MAVQHVFMTAILFAWALTISAYPNARKLRQVQRSYPQASAITLQQPSVPTNDTNAPPLPRTGLGAIECFQESSSRRTTDVDGCRPTLNYFRSWPNYRSLQEFREQYNPKLPSKPPYAVHHEHSNCAVQIASNGPNVADDFSFEQARALATEILEVCRDRGGRGGFAPIGQRSRWRVTVIGFRLPPGPPDQTNLMVDVGVGNWTLVPVVGA